MDTKTFINTLNSILGVDLWPSVNGLIDNLGGDDLQLSYYYRDTMKLVGLRYDDLNDSISQFLRDKQGENTNLRNKGGDVWYILKLAHPEAHYRLGYWDGERNPREYGFSFDLNLHFWDGDLKNDYIYLNINHQAAWTNYGGAPGDMLYIIDSDELGLPKINPTYINWTLSNPIK